MRWSIESNWSPRGDRALVLRTDHNGPVAMVMDNVEDGAGYTALILEPGLPSRSGFRHIIGAVLWVENYVVKHIDPRAKFGAIPSLKGQCDAAVGPRHPARPARAHERSRAHDHQQR